MSQQLQVLRDVPYEVDTTAYTDITASTAMDGALSKQKNTFPHLIQNLYRTNHLIACMDFPE